MNDRTSVSLFVPNIILQYMYIDCDKAKDFYAFVISLVKRCHVKAEYVPYLGLQNTVLGEACRVI